MNILEKLIYGKKVTEQDIYDELYEMCDREHASCNCNCLVYEANNEEPVKNGTPDAKEYGCACFKKGKAMYEFLTKEEKKKENVVYGYSDSKFRFVVNKYRQYIINTAVAECCASAGWVRERISETGNDYDLELALKYPNSVVMYDYETKFILKLFDYHGKMTIDFSKTHMSHCNQGENEGICKYGDEGCPALNKK